MGFEEFMADPTSVMLAYVTSGDGPDVEGLTWREAFEFGHMAFGMELETAIRALRDRDAGGAEDLESALVAGALESLLDSAVTGGRDRVGVVYDRLSA